MSTEDGDNHSAPRLLDDHAHRNRIQLKMLKVAMARRKHAAYIDAMLDRRAPDKPATTPRRADADKSDRGADS